jgi:transcriptional regulator with GAF, ATPase, and Fis domain
MAVEVDRRAQASEAVEKALVAAARALTSQLDVKRVYAATLQAVEDVFGAVASWILLYEPSGGVLRTALARGVGSEPFCDLAIPPDVGILGLAFTTRKVVFVPNVREDRRWFDVPRVHASDLRSVFTVPLLHQDEPLGVLGLDAPSFDAARPPTEVDIQRLEALAAQAAIAIANARLYAASEQDRRRLRALLQERKRLRTHVTHLEQEIRAAGSFGEIVGDSDGLRDVLQQAALVAPADTTVLIVGETGTGKELLARLIHERSARAKGPFVAVNCAALPETLVESELFGHEKGAFTGAIARKPGKFEIAHRGTLFLDEIGDLPAEAQAKLLRVLQDRQVQRIGGTQSLPVDVRVIAATNQDLTNAIGQSRFRSDLFYRLSVFPLRLPPLRERPEDIDVLALHFVRQLAARLRKPIRELSVEAVARLRAYHWPGNVRELQNVIERAVILCRGDVLDADLVAIVPIGHSSSVTHATPPDSHANDVGVQRPRREPPLDDHPMTLADAERRVILGALEAARWRISGAGGAAALLDLKPTTLHAKMKKLGIRRSDRN